MPAYGGVRWPAAGALLLPAAVAIESRRAPKKSKRKRQQHETWLSLNGNLRCFGGKRLVNGKTSEEQRTYWWLRSLVRVWSRAHEGEGTLDRVFFSARGRPLIWPEAFARRQKTLP